MNKGLYTGVSKGLLKNNSGLSKGLFNGLVNIQTNVDVSSYFSEYQYYSTSVIPLSQKDIYKRTFRSLVASNIIYEVDRLFIFAGIDANISLTSLINPSLTRATAVNNPTFSQMLGYASNGSNSYVNSQFNFGVGPKYTRNNNSFGVYSRTEASVGGAVLMGVRNGSLEGSTINPRNTTPLTSALNNSKTASSVDAGTSKGWFTTARTNSTSFQLYRNGVQLQSVLASSFAPASLNFYFGCSNENGTAGLFSTRQFSAGYMGSGNINQMTLFDIVQTHLHAIGASV